MGVSMGNVSCNLSHFLGQMIKLFLLADGPNTSTQFAAQTLQNKETLRKVVLCCIFCTAFCNLCRNVCSRWEVCYIEKRFVPLVSPGFGRQVSKKKKPSETTLRPYGKDNVLEAKTAQKSR